MKTLDIKKVPASLLEYVRSLGQDPVILTLKEKPVAVLLPVKNADLETVSLSFNPEFLALIERSKRRLHTEGGLSTEEVRRQLGIPAKSKQGTKAKNGKPGVNKAKTRSRNLTGGADGGQV